MDKNIFSERLVKLVVFDPENGAGLLVCWRCDSEYSRLLDSDPAPMWTAKQKRSSQK